MSKISRVEQKIFGESGGVGEFGKFGSEAAGSIAYTKDPATIQELSQFLQGLFSVTANGAEPPRIQDINALYYLFSRQIAYCLQAGIPEWDEDTDYFNEKSFVQGSDGSIYIAIRGDEVVKNINKNPLTESTWWRKILDKNGKAVDTGNVAGVTPGAGGLLLLALASLSSYSPLMNGSATAGTRNTPAREDHRHPTDTTRASASRKINTASGLLGGGDLTQDRTLTLNYQTVRNIIYPTGSFYVQYPNAASNTDATEFPSAYRPATMFGGTWTEVFSSESVFFRTRGSDSNSGRANGYQSSGIPEISGWFSTQIIDKITIYQPTDGTLFRYTAVPGNAGKTGGDIDQRVDFSSGRKIGYTSNGETRPKNRRVKIWKRVG